MIKANLIHLGMNINTSAQAHDPLACVTAEWTGIVEHMAERGLNMAVIELAEGVMYESHPEIAVKGAWSVARLRGELARMRKLGIEPIPKLNFSATHDEWLGEYGRMVSTPEYSRSATSSTSPDSSTWAMMRRMCVARTGMNSWCCAWAITGGMTSFGS